MTGRTSRQLQLQTPSAYLPTMTYPSAPICESNIGSHQACATFQHEPTRSAEFPQLLQHLCEKAVRASVSNAKISCTYRRELAWTDPRERRYRFKISRMVLHIMEVTYSKGPSCSKILTPSRPSTASRKSYPL